MQVAIFLIMISPTQADNLPKVLQPLLDADKVTFYSVDGKKSPRRKEELEDPKKFWGFPILGRIELTKDDRKKVANALATGLEPKGMGFARCFWPRHAFRIEKAGIVTDFVICYECHWFKIYNGDKEQNIVTDNKPVEFLNKMLKDANIPIAP